MALKLVFKKEKKENNRILKYFISKNHKYNSLTNINNTSQKNRNFYSTDNINTNNNINNNYRSGKNEFDLSNNAMP